jgi:beta-carotene/zeaxanthin 4-ketolase
MGIIVAFIVISAWLLHLIYILSYLEFAFSNPWLYVHILVQTFLYTGLFITAHDAMHGAISKNKTINNTFGNIATFLFAGMSYKKLRKNHGLHHKAPASAEDPDFYTRSQNFWIWWGVFMWRYLTIWQLIIMAAAYNVFIHLLGLNEIRVLVLWAFPAILGTLQLFWVGVWWPHREPHLPHMMPHRARSQHKNHLWALISCYFFGYHWEHHEDQYIPWWKLYKTKE